MSSSRSGNCDLSEKIRRGDADLGRGARQFALGKHDVGSATQEINRKTCANADGQSGKRTRRLQLLPQILWEFTDKNCDRVARSLDLCRKWRNLRLELCLFALCESNVELVGDAPTKPLLHEFDVLAGSRSRHDRRGDRADDRGARPQYVSWMPECRAPLPLVLPPSSDRVSLIREAFRLEWLTIGWMTVEAAVGIAAGWMASSLVLSAFGLDSLIELASAGVLTWRLSVELRHGQVFSERAERMASRIGGGLLFVLAAYVTAAAVWQLWKGTGEEFSWPGFIVALVAIPAMRYLASRKRAIAEKIGSRALRADAVEAVTCGWLSLVVVVSLTAQWLTGAWWIDGVGSLAIVWFLVKEGRKAWSGDGCESCG